LLILDGKEIPHDSVIRWNVWDNDDNVEWVMTGIYKAPRQHTHPFYRDIEPYVVYLGGGIDFGSAIGTVDCWSEIIENNPCHNLKVIGRASDINSHITKYKGE